MIDKKHMLPLLVSACPDFKEKYEAFLEEWKDELEKPNYLALSHFASLLIDKLNQNETEEFPLIFSTIEDLHVHGDDYVKCAATIGLLEAIQNHMGWAKKDPEIFKKYLGEETTKWWDALNKFWNGEIPRVEI